MRSLLAASVALFLLGCPPVGGPVDAAVPEVDAGLDVACDTPDDCAPFNAACRQQRCAEDVPCSDDLECGLGERCLGHQCRFRGCTDSAQCATGFCDAATYSCAECGTNADCPVERPVCDTALHQCVQCRTDAQCAPPGPPHCSPEGRCVGCLTSDQCPNGLSCSAGRTCVGAPMNADCPQGTSCATGLVCVNVGNSPTCLGACALYQPNCAAGQLCYALSYATTTSLVFESMGPIGVCFAPQSGNRGPREPCVRANGGSNCQPNLQCMPESASLSLCRPYCNPAASGTCGAGEKCTAFVGDFSGREFGVCMPDTGFGAKCDTDQVCRAGLTCQAWDDPSDVDDVGTVCQFNVGDAGALAPCRDVALADGGVVAASRTCRSGACVKDPLVSAPPTAPYYCFGACEADGDCGDAGVCDADFPMTTASGTQGFVRGCRPRCESEQDCGPYDAGVSCRVRVVASSSAPRFSATCSPSAGALQPGQACTSSSQCRSALCVLDDSRGVRRTGVCAAPCRDGDGCAAPSDALPTACQPTTYLVTRGFDGVAGTLDDGLVSPRLCSGASCATDEGCRPDGGTAVCAPALSPASPLSALVLRCEAPTTGTLRGGEACTLDSQCLSGACGVLQAPSTGAGRACFEACTGTSTCSRPGMTCRAGGLQVATARAVASLDSCAP